MKRITAAIIALQLHSAAAAPAAFTFSQGGFGGGVVNGSFTGEDLDGNGQLWTGNSEITSFSMTYSGGGGVGAFSLGFGDLFGLVYDLDGGPLGDGLGGAIEGIGANNGVNSYEAGPGPVDECGIGLDCAFVSDSTTTLFSQQLVAINGGLLTPEGISEPSQDTDKRASTDVASSTAITQTGKQTPALIAQRFTTFISKSVGPVAATGLAAGGGVSLAAGDLFTMPMGYWASYSRNDLQNDFSSTAYDGSVSIFLGGIDWTFGDNLLVGLAAGYERQDFVTEFNRGEQETDGVTVAPYVGYLINDNWSVDGTAGFTYSDVEQFRTQAVQRITSDTDAWRKFAAVNLNWFGGRDRWLFSGSGGLLYAEDSFDGFIEQTGAPGGLFTPDRHFDVGQAIIGGEIGYAIGGIVPFLNGRFVYDIKESEVEVGPGQPDPGTDRSEFQAGFGLRYYGSDNGISADLEFTTVEGRDNIDSYTISATLRIDL